VILSDISSVSAGHPFRGKITGDPSAPVYVVQMKDVSEHEGIAWQTCAHSDLSGSREPLWLAEDDILVAARGSTNYAIKIGDLPEQGAAKAVAAPQYFVVRPDRQRILPDFLALLLNCPETRRYFQRNAEGSVTKSIRRRVLDQTPIPLPSMEKQRACVALYQSLRKERELARQLIRNGEQLLDKITQDLLNDGD
jgi:hypothetical protein